MHAKPETKQKREYIQTHLVFLASTVLVQTSAQVSSTTQASKMNKETDKKNLGRKLVREKRLCAKSAKTTKLQKSVRNQLLSVYSTKA